MQDGQEECAESFFFHLYKKVRIIVMGENYSEMKHLGRENNNVKYIVERGF